jgi:uncharacterized membrane protein
MPDNQNAPGAAVQAPGDTPDPAAHQPSQTVMTTARLYQGPIPHPEQLAEFERLVPGAAVRLIDLGLEESRHRKAQEESAMKANIAAQEQQLAIAAHHSRAVFQSDLVSQTLGFLVTMGCVAGAVYLSINGHETVAALLCAVPTGALIQAFFVKRKP